MNDPWIPAIAAIVSALIGASAVLINEGLKEGGWLKLILRRRGPQLGGVLGVLVPAFDKLAIDEREEIISFLKKKVEDFCREISRREYWVDFHGNIVVIFLRPQEKKGDVLPRAMYTLFEFASKLHKEPNMRRKLGLLLHAELEPKFFKIVDKTHLIGSAFSETYALMPYTSHGHFFISKIAFEYLSQVKEIQNKADKFQAYRFHDILKNAHEMYSYWENDVGQQTLPPDRVNIEHRDAERFIERLVSSEKVTIIGLTHENIARFLEQALKKRNRRFWEELKIVFPTKGHLELLIEADRTTEVRLRQYENGRLSVTTFLLGQASEHQDRWDCLEYGGTLPFIGTWMTDASGIASTRIAPVLPGADTRKTHYLEFFEGMKAYSEVADAFKAICSNSSRVTEWNIQGKQKGELVTFSGLIERKSISRVKGGCFPVVLIMLHESVAGVHKLALQERDVYNADSDHGKLSNISGRVTDLDVFAALGKKPSHAYLTERYGRGTNIDRLFVRETGLEWNQPLPEDAWVQAALREVREEIGLQVPAEKLKTHARLITLPYKDSDLVFRIFSLYLDGDDGALGVKGILAGRPQARLEHYTITDLRHHHQQQRFNNLLQRHYEETFEPILKTELGIQ